MSATSSYVRRPRSADLGAGGRGFESRHPDWSDTLFESADGSFVQALRAVWRGWMAVVDRLPRCPGRQFSCVSDSASLLASAICDEFSSRPLLAAWTVRAGLLAVRMSNRGEGRALWLCASPDGAGTAGHLARGAPVLRRY